MGMELVSGKSLTDYLSSCAALNLQHPNFVARDAAGTRAHILEMSEGRCRFAAEEASSPVGFEAASARLGGIWIKYLSWTGQGLCQTETLRSPGHHLALHIILKGAFEVSHGGRVLSARAGDMVVVNEPGVIRKRWRGAHAMLNVMIDREAVNRTMVGEVPSGALAAMPLTVIELARTRTFVDMVETVVRDVGGNGMFLSDPSMSASVERLLIMLLYRALWDAQVQKPKEFSGVAPYYVRRAEQFVEANYGRPVSIEALVAASGVSSRTLYYGFSKYRGMSPQKYVKTMRLGEARRRLLASAPGALRIADLAASVGYESPSRFAQDYRQMFGESASSTLSVRSH